MNTTGTEMDDRGRWARPAQLTVADAVSRARDLRPRLLAEQEETERRTRHSPELQADLVALGFYDLLRPSTFGGHEFDLRSFLQVMRELARGCMSTAWAVCLSSGHNLQIASWWPEEVQRQVFAEESTSAALTVKPSGMLARDGGSWTLTGKYGYASGIPYATHFIGHAIADFGGGKRPAIFLARRAQWSVEDDWGSAIGLRGTGSNTVHIDRARLDDGWVLPHTSTLNVDVSAGTAGLELHGNPLYGGRAMGVFSLELATLAIGAVWAALDVYEEMMLTRGSNISPMGSSRLAHPDYATCYGEAHARLVAAEAIVDRAADEFGERCADNAHGRRPFGHGDDLLIDMLGREAFGMAWAVLSNTIMRTVGSSAAVAGSRLDRVWRDMTMAWGHILSGQRDETARQYTYHRFEVTSRLDGCVTCT